MADALLSGAAQHASPRNALVELPVSRRGRRRRRDGLEGFARTFLLASFRLAGGTESGVAGLAERYAQGVVVGTAPRGPERWPRIRDRSQAVVEAATVALALFESRPWIWDELPDTSRQQIAAWLSGVNDSRVWDNNWHLFPVVVNAFLKSVGAEHRADVVERSLEAVDGFYRGEGWYSDGAGENFDHYCGWAFHLYALHWARMDGDRSDPERAATFRLRAQRFLDDYRHLFGSSGSPLPQGRSLIYRFAAAAPFWAGALAGCTPLRPGETRRLASGVVRYFVDRGALRNGVLTIGWQDAFPAIAQAYSGPGSPYWASKAFLGLLLPADDPAWTSVEEPMPVERQDFVKTMQVPGFVASGTQAGGVVRVLNHRSHHAPLNETLAGARPFYRKLAYATDAIGDVAPGLDSQITVFAEGRVRSRQRFETLLVADGKAASRHRPAAEGPRRRVLGRVRRNPREDLRWIATVAVPHGALELRVHAPLRGRAACGGYALAGNDPPPGHASGTIASVRRGDGIVSLVAGLHGFDSAEVRRSTDVNPAGRHSATPLAWSSPTSAVLVVLVGLGFDLDVDEAVAGVACVVDEASLVTLEIGGRTYHVELDPHSVVERLEEVGREGGSHDLR